MNKQRAELSRDVTKLREKAITAYVLMQKFRMSEGTHSARGSQLTESYAQAFQAYRDAENELFLSDCDEALANE